MGGTPQASVLNLRLDQHVFINGRNDLFPDKYSNRKGDFNMSTLKYARVFSWFRGFTALLLIGLILPSGFALAEAPAAGSFGKYLPANGAENQPISSTLKWDLSESA